MGQISVKAQKHEGIEVGRLVGLIAVISIHASLAFGDYHATAFTVSELSRFAVPMFFSASGYFWKDDFIKAPSKALVPMFFRVLVPFVVWVIIYWAADRFSLFYARTYFGSLKSYLLFLINGGVGFHLWFLPALFIGTAFCLYLLRSVQLNTAIAVALILYAFGCVVFYSSIATGIGIYDIFYRNGLLFAPIFLLLGYASRKYQAQNRISVAVAISILLFGALVHLSEGYFLTNLFPKGHEMSFGTIPLGIGAFWTALSFPRCATRLPAWGANVFDGYLVHLLVLNTITHHIAQGAPIVALTVICSTFVISLAFSQIKSWALGLNGLNALTRSPPS